MADFVIVDTDILIDVSRGVPEALSSLSHLGQQHALAISVVTQMELLVGCRDTAELRALAKFLQRFTILPVTEPVSDMAVNLLMQYRLSHGLLIADALIAATAIQRQLALISKNQRDYRFIPELNLLAYPPAPS
jgi:predicted nucleic acid-binding protein